MIRPPNEHIKLICFGVFNFLAAISDQVLFHLFSDIKKIYRTNKIKAKKNPKRLFCLRFIGVCSFTAKNRQIAVAFLLLFLLSLKVAHSNTSIWHTKAINYKNRFPFVCPLIQSIPTFLESESKFVFSNLPTCQVVL